MARPAGRPRRSSDEASFPGVLRPRPAELADGRLRDRRSPLVTLGIAPTHAGDRVRLPGPRADGGADVRGPSARTRSRRFEEKPAAARAAELLETPGVAWNAGIFLWRRRAIRAALERFAPDVLGAGRRRRRLGRALAAAYATVRATSIDYAVMEPAARGRPRRDGRARRRLERPRHAGPRSSSALGAPGDRRRRGGGHGRAAGPGRPARRPSSADGRPRRPARFGSMTPSAPVAILRGARAGLPIVQAAPRPRAPQQEVHP